MRTLATTAARVLVRPLRALGGGLIAVLKRCLVALRTIGTTAARAIRATSRAALALAQRAMGMVERALLQPLEKLARTLVAAARQGGRLMIAGVTPIFRYGGRIIAGAATTIARWTTRIVRWLWRPIAGVSHRARRLWSSASNGLGTAARRFGTRIRRVSGERGSMATAQWRRTRPAAQHARASVRRALDDARRGVRRWAKALARNKKR